MPLSRVFRSWSLRQWSVIGAVVVVLVAALVTWRVVKDTTQTRFAEAAELAPKGAVRFSWTDWSGVREELGASVSADSPAADVTDFLLDAFDHDLTSTSALEESAPALHTDLGFSPATLEWELFTQAEDGAVVFLKMPEDWDPDVTRDRLRGAGFTEPRDDDGVWEGGADLLQGLSGPVTPELASLQVDEEHNLIVGSDDPRYLAERAKNAAGSRGLLGQVIAAVGPALSALAYADDRACAELAMSDASPADRTRAAELVGASGGVHPMSGFAMGVQPGGTVRVAMGFETSDQARADADSRSMLAAGPAPGQGGSFPDRFSLGDVTASAQVLTMSLKPREGAFVFSDLNHGPVLFATC